MATSSWTLIIHIKRNTVKMLHQLVFWLWHMTYDIRVTSFIKSSWVNVFSFLKQLELLGFSKYFQSFQFTTFVNWFSNHFFFSAVLSYKMSFFIDQYPAFASNCFKTSSILQFHYGRLSNLNFIEKPCNMQCRNIRKISKNYIESL